MRCLLLCVALLLAGCAQEATPPTPTVDPACADYLRYGDLTGTTVTLRGAPLAGGYDRFTACTGARIVVAGDDAPADLVYVADHRALAAMVAQPGAVQPAPALAAAEVAQQFPPAVVGAAGVNGTLYGVPIDVGVASVVWYSPRYFTAHGYAVPSTAAELTALLARITADGGVPWCATQPTQLADTLADQVLRTAGPDVFDDWVAHRIPFDDAAVASALDVLASFGRPAVGPEGNIALRSGGCALLQGSAATEWPSDSEVNPDGDVFAFALPGASGERPSALVRGGFAVATADRREIAAVLGFLAGAQWRAAKPATSGPLGILQNPDAVVRYSAAELMPPAVGQVAFPQWMTAWSQGLSTAETLATVEAAWPR